MKLSLNTAPSTEPVSTADMKSFLKVDLSDDDTLIASLVKSARIEVERYCRISLITQTWDLYMDALPQRIDVPLPPLQSITSIQTFDDDYTATTESSDIYKVVTFSDAVKGNVHLKNGESWSTDITPAGNGAKITFVSGFGDAATDVPDLIITAIKLTVSHWYENRESQEMPAEAKRLLSRYRVIRL